MGVIEWYAVVLSVLILLANFLNVCSPEQYRKGGAERSNASDAVIVGSSLCRIGMMLPILLWAVGVI
jgi:hypothetical protein